MYRFVVPYPIIFKKFCFQCLLLQCVLKNQISSTNSYYELVGKFFANTISINNYGLLLQNIKRSSNFLTQVAYVLYLKNTFMSVCLQRENEKQIKSTRNEQTLQPQYRLIPAHSAHFARICHILLYSQKRGHCHHIGSL